MKTGKGKILSLDLVFTVILIIFVSLLLIDSRTYPGRTKQFPQLIGIITLGLLILEVVSKIRKPPADKDESAETLQDRKFGRRNLGNLIIALAGYLFLIFILGHVPASIIFLIITPFVTGMDFKRNYWKVLIMVIIMSVAVYLLFVSFLHVRFIPGFLF